MINILHVLKRTTLIVGVLLCAACSSWKSPCSSSPARPVIFPDYAEVTIPSNIAPINFMVEEAGHIQATFSHPGGQVIRVKGKDGVVRIPLKKWRYLLEAAKGGNIDVQVSVWDEAHPEGISYLSFPIHVANEPVDQWISYRLIEPGYVGWRQLGIYQRDLTSFDESAIVTNRKTNTACINCHNYPSYSPESMLFHARGKNGGTILYKDGKLQKIDFKSIGPKKNTTYPAWHPDGRYIAFSSNTTHQVFFGEGEQPIEVFDTASDLVIYDTQSGQVLTDPRFMTEDKLETFPSWSPDGKYLYFCSYQAHQLPVYFSSGIAYDLLRVPFDPVTGTLGNEVEVVYDAAQRGGSTSYPRISPDGRYLLYTWSHYGTFPVWHEEADLRMMDLQTMEDVDVSQWNDADDADSYHSWSSNGRWVVYGTRRMDGRYTRLSMAYFDEAGNADKPFLLPQEDPRQNVWRLMSFNVPEFMQGKVELPKEAADMFYSED